MAKFVVAKCIAVFIALVALNAQAVPTISVVPNSASNNVGGTTERVDLHISGLGGGSAPSLGAYEVTFRYDADALALTGVSWGTGLDPFGLGDLRSLEVGPGTIDLFESSLDSADDLDRLQPAAFLLASLSFDKRSTNGSLLTLAVNSAADAMGAPLDVAVNNAAAVPEPPIFLLAMTGISLVGAATATRRRVAIGASHA